MKRSAIAALAATIGTAVAAHGHGGVTIERDPCVQKTANRAVHFTVYQPELDPGGEYCADVPKSGSSIVVFDLVDPELRAVPLEISIVKAGANGSEPLLHLPARLYPTGVINAEVTLSPPGRYSAILTPASGTALVFPLRVEIGYSPLVWLLLLLLAAPALYYWSQRRSAGETAGGEAGRNLAVVK